MFTYILYHNFYSVCELWCGQSMAQISIYTIKDQIVVEQDVVNHYQTIIEAVSVKNLISDMYMVWSYVHPGCIVYQWDQKSRSITNKLDCSKLVPCSESLKSIAIEEHLSPSNCQASVCFHFLTTDVILPRFLGDQFGSVKR